VVVGAHASDVRDALDAGRAELVECERWDAGLSASLRCGVAAAGDADWVVILLGDEPGMPPAAISRVLDAAAGAPAQVGAVRARWDGRPGHPVALRGALAARAEHLRGDVGARALLDAAVVLEVDCTDLGLPDDVDTPEDLEAMQR
jgi:nicotine blue oxidoreductase